MSTPDSKQEHEHHNLNYRAFSSFAAFFRLISDSLGAFLNFVPPLNAAITGLISLLEMGEAMFLSEENRKRRAVKAITSAAGVGLMVAAAVLIFNPATAPIASALIVVSIAVSAFKEGFLWYKRHHDYHQSITELNELQTKLHSATHPDKVKALNAQVAAVTDHIIHCRQRIHDHRTGFMYNALSLVGAVLLTVAAFALVGAIVSNPIGLGIAGIAILGLATAYAIRERIRSRHHQSTVAPLPSEPSTAKETDSERTAEIAQHLVEHSDPNSKITTRSILKSDIEYLKRSDTPSSPSGKEDVNTLNTPTSEYRDDDSEGEGESKPTQSPNH